MNLRVIFNIVIFNDGFMLNYTDIQWSAEQTYPLLNTSKLDGLAYKA